MGRRIHLLIATATLAGALVPFAASPTPTGGLVDRMHNVREALMGAGGHFYGLGDILSGATPRYDSLPL
ncbi:hypothetical protein FAF44_41580 [Nonomuraea sp. MG754425]|uniref:hypothetical protein n=1 Tax=Nonomuraea sp. MG754425 TaxID=2570319 RepID=UPI001F392BC9|nr:hypothetical protein [Nonomuraea sp. MG754425]MCF6474825.1 hypothetical protein [Nonomuraea sp. MG754425]